MSPLASSPRVVTADQARQLCAACKPSTQPAPANIVGISCPWLDAGLIDILADLGAKWVRIDCPWRDIEAYRGTYSWYYFDGVMNSLHNRGIEPLVTLNKTPNWCATWADFFPKFQAFTVAVMVRYPSIRSLEIFNEPDRPDAGWMFPGDNPFNFVNEYAATLAEASIAAHRLNPAITIVSGGLSPNYGAPLGLTIGDYLNAMKNLGAWNACDVVAIHPYDWLGHFAAIQAAAGPAYGFAGKPLWFNEFGYQTTVESVRTLKIQAWWAEIHSTPATPMNGNFAYTLWPGNPATETQMSLLNADRSPRPAYAALKALLHG